MSPSSGAESVHVDCNSSVVMSEQPPRTKQNREPTPPKGERGDPARERVNERYAEHRRWIGGDPDDPCCRGFD
jgi:hypothetical protein